ncbi:MAG TPA: hypothetical protein VFC46_06055, partial [Humisphaera sp.]|nr:hypothetical protein [Humisphaera sp.]
MKLICKKFAGLAVACFVAVSALMGGIWVIGCGHAGSTAGGNQSSPDNRTVAPISLSVTPPVDS